VTDFKTYYANHFKSDIFNFLSQIPIEGNKHHSNEDIFIQYFFLTPSYTFLDIIPEKIRGNFIIALFWTVLIDQVCYSNYRSSYYLFKKKTNYPKFIGNCTAPSLMSSQCGHNQHPTKILLAVNDYTDTGNIYEIDKKPFKNYENKIERQRIQIDILLQESISIVEVEISAFVDKHHPEIDGKILWQYCLSELPIYFK